MQKIVTGKVVLSGYVIAPKEDLAAIKATLPEHIRLTRDEPGCIIFQVKQDENNPHRFNVYEEFKDKAAFDAHQTRIIGTEWAKASRNLAKFYERK